MPGKAGLQARPWHSWGFPGPLAGVHMHSHGLCCSAFPTLEDISAGSTKKRNPLEGAWVACPRWSARDAFPYKFPRCRSSHRWAFGKWLAERGNLSASTGEVSQLGTWVSSTSFWGKSFVFPLSETQERGRAVTSHSVAHGSAKNHSVESTQNGCRCSSVSFRSCMERKKVEDTGFCTILENPADSHPPFLAEPGPGRWDKMARLG